MMFDDTYVWLYRRITERLWYRNIPVKTLFIHCIIKANWTDKRLEGEIIKRGTFITSVRNLAEETGLTEQQVKTALVKLEKDKMITKTSSKMNTLVIVLNYDLYQKNAPECANLATQFPTQSATQLATQCANTNEPINKGYFESDALIATQFPTQSATQLATTTNKYIKNNKEKRYAQIECEESKMKFDKENAFKEFWDIYPKKKDKQRAHDKFMKKCINEEIFQCIIRGLELQKKTNSWTKDDGRFVPHAKTWLHNELWKDEVVESEFDAPKVLKGSDW